MLDRSATPVIAASDAISLAARRMLFAGLIAVTMAGVLWLATTALSPHGAGNIIFLVLFAVSLPWPVVGFWNAAIGLTIMRLARDPVAAVNPLAARIRGDEPIVALTAILMCIRNESPDTVVRNLEPMLDGLVRAGVARLFHVYVLSDTSIADVAAEEDACFDALSKKWRDTIAVTYRRRAVNTAFKSGNIRDFCDRWGGDHEFAVTLDADSFMPAETVLRLVRIMQANPSLGILQTLIVGLPSVSAFARLFQFGMRLGMRSFTLGSAWWQGDCGPYWGHNAILRLAPFIDHCRMPVLPQRGPLGGYLLSHDQVEAVLMRRAGYEVRVLPEDGISWEENPPTILEFIRRDLRWCQGNMQYWQLLRLPGLKPVSRFQLVFAILMYLGSPAWIAMLTLGTIVIAFTDTLATSFQPGAATALFWVTMSMIFAPKLASTADVLLRPSTRHSFGGSFKFAANVVIETLFTFLLAPLMSFVHTAFLIRLFLMRRGVAWNSQTRQSHAVPWRLALENFWLPSLAAFTVIGVAAVTRTDISYALIPVGGLALSVPFAVASASPLVGALFVRLGLCVIPEEIEQRGDLRPLHLPAIEAPYKWRQRHYWRAALDGARTALGVIRSLRIYYGDRRRGPAMDRLYRRFVKPGDLVFDIGAHVGDRVAAFRRLEARVIAAEPQPALVKTLRLLYGRDQAVTINQAALGRSPGTVALKINLDNPTVSTASDDFVSASRNAPGWEAQRWTRSIDVPVTTLDALITRYGTPVFVKIDVEGFEAEVLAGLTRPVNALSFEFTTIQRDIALACIERCMSLGYERFNAALGESQSFVNQDWTGALAIKCWLTELPPEANSGDIYAAIGE